MTIEHVVFVHGTGVREDSYLRTLKSVRQGIAAAGLGVEVHQCYWGGVGGVVLQAGGASVPGYEDSGGGAAIPNAGVWELLGWDSFHEMRVLGLDLPSGTPGTLERWLRDLDLTEPTRALLGEAHVGSFWVDSIDDVLSSPEFRRMDNGVGDLPNYPLQQAALRAVLASALQRAERAGVPACAAVQLDVLYGMIENDANCVVRGAKDWAASAAKGLGAYFFVERKRGERTDSTTGFLGDILRYQARGTQVRELIGQRIRDLGLESGVALVGHSLGGIASVELLATEELSCVDMLITVGSQAPYLYEIDALATLPWGTALPSQFPPWVNVYDPADLLAYVASDVFEGVEDIRVENGRGFPASHSAYFDHRTPNIWNKLRPHFQ